MHIELAEDLGRIQQVLVIVDPVPGKAWLADMSITRRESAAASVGHNVLLGVEGQQRQVQHDRQPVAIDHEEEGQESMNGGFRDNVGVETVAEIDRVDVVTGSEDRVSLAR